MTTFKESERKKSERYVKGKIRDIRNCIKEINACLSLIKNEIRYW